MIVMLGSPWRWPISKSFGSCAERRVDVLVGDDRDPSSGERQLDGLPDQVPVALVVGVHGDGRVAEHGLGPGGGHHDRVVAVAVADRHQLTVVVGVLHLDVAERGEAAGAPVDDALRAVDQAVVEHLLEDREDGPRQALVHGEALTGPVDGVAEPLHLAQDLAPGLGLPLPHPLDELLPAQVVAGHPLACELTFDDVLRGDAGVVHARQPQRGVALHPPSADQRVLDRVVERVPNVQRPGDVRWRNDDAERLAVARGLEYAGLYPTLVQPLLYFGGLVLRGEFASLGGRGIGHNASLRSRWGRLPPRWDAADRGGRGRPGHPATGAAPPATL
jgi:hypothetical protein